MKRIQTCVAGLLLFCLLSLAAFAQGVAGGEWDKLIQEANQLYRAGNYPGAVEVAKKALEVAEKSLGPDHPDVATSLNNLAELYRTQGQYAQAEPLYKRSLAISEKSLGPDHPDVATVKLGNSRTGLSSRSGGTATKWAALPISTPAARWGG